MRLSPHHRDPFDRILLARILFAPAMTAPAIFRAIDAALAPYAARITFFDENS